MKYNRKSAFSIFAGLRRLFKCQKLIILQIYFIRFSGTFQPLIFCPGQTAAELTTANILLAVSSINDFAQLWVLQFFVIVIIYFMYALQK